MNKKNIILIVIVLGLVIGVYNTLFFVEQRIQAIVLQFGEPVKVIQEPGLNNWFSEVTPQMEIAQTEVFGPVLSVMRYSTEEEALSIINGTEYGLVGGVFTKDLNKAHRLSQKIRAGQIFINEWFAGGVETPFGGFGKSGYGREKGREALWNYVQTKNIASNLS